MATKQSLLIAWQDAADALDNYLQNKLEVTKGSDPSAARINRDILTYMIREMYPSKKGGLAGKQKGAVEPIGESKT